MNLPLDGLTVVDLTRHLPGPYATMLLSDLGAEVWKVEHPDGGDVARRYPPFTSAGEGAFFATLNRNKKSIALDLKVERTGEVFESLLGEADVLVESFRPGVLGRLGHPVEGLREVHTELVTCSISGFGHEGPESDRAGHDLTYASRAGLIDRVRRSRQTGRDAEKSPPVVPDVQLADLSGALFAAIRILGALVGRARHGRRGPHLDISLTESALSLLAPHVTAEATTAGSNQSNLLGGDRPAYTLYETADGRHLAVGALEPKFWSAFIEELGLEDLATEGLASGQAAGSARRAVAEVIKQQTLETWLQRFEGVDACVEPVQTLVSAMEDELFRGREVFFELAGTTHVRTPATPIERENRPAPKLGEHTESVLRKVGYSASEVESFRADGIC